jgi:hypothetical protein
MTQRNGGGITATAVVGIIAGAVVVMFFAWLLVIRDAKPPETIVAPPAPADSNHDVEIKVDLPDSVVITP